MINKHLSHDDDIDVGKDEQIVEIERKLSMRRQRILMRMKMMMMMPMRIIKGHDVDYIYHVHDS